MEFRKQLIIVKKLNNLLKGNIPRVIIVEEYEMLVKTIIVVQHCKWNCKLAITIYRYN